jgi:glycosyltransferase involved in cell wall biosynthesis
VKVAVVIPAYNEEAAISTVVAEINSINTDYELTPVVVNDCSKDATGEIIDQLDCVALHLPVNLGIGGAVQSGFLYAYENDFDYAVQLDGDGQHPAHQISHLIDLSIKQHLDVVIGSRFLTKQGFQSSFMRRVGIRWFSILNKMLTGNFIADTTSGFRLYNRKALEVVTEYYPDEYPEPEALVLYAKRKLRVGEMPVEMRERQGGTSSINALRSLYYMWKVTLGVLFTYIRA